MARPGFFTLCRILLVYSPLTMSELTEVTIYTDGACSGNPGPGGYGAVLQSGRHRREISGGFRLTTNNRMEIMAVIEGLKMLKRPCRVVVYSDSQYVVNAINKGWAKRWRENGWRRNRKDTAENSDLWARLLDLLDEHEVEFRWVRGHSEVKGNERADKLAVEAYSKPGLPEDEGYRPQQSLI